jgi:hypothetical protein
MSDGPLAYVHTKNRRVHPITQAYIRLESIRLKLQKDLGGC